MQVSFEILEYTDNSDVLPRMIDTHRRRCSWQSTVDRFLAPTGSAKGQFAEPGFAPEQISIKPNVLADWACQSVPREDALSIGRLSEMKQGVSVLLHTWAKLDFPLSIVGDSPLLDETPKAALVNVEDSLWARGESRLVALESENKEVGGF